MDAHWFKARSRAKGLTIIDLGDVIGRDRSAVSRFYTGRQVMTFDQARKIADALEEPLPEVLARAGIANAREAQQLTPGFSDSDAALWVPAVGVDRSCDDQIADALGRKPGVDVWEVRGRSLSLIGYLPGDRILVDTGAADRALSGDAVIAQVYDWAQGSAKTLLRQLQTPVLVSHSPDAGDWKAHVVDQDRVIIKGVVRASWRR